MKRLLVADDVNNADGSEHALRDAIVTGLPIDVSVVDVSCRPS
jgi:hypothetical protein